MSTQINAPYWKTLPVEIVIVIWKKVMKIKKREFEDRIKYCEEDRCYYVRYVQCNHVEKYKRLVVSRCYNWARAKLHVTSLYVCKRHATKSVFIKCRCGRKTIAYK